MSHDLLRQKSTTSLDHAIEFAHTVFHKADKNSDGDLSKTEIRTYFRENPEDKYHILGPNFTWKSFFESMDTDGNSKFDIDEFTRAVVNVYHDERVTDEDVAGMEANPVPEPPEPAQAEASIEATMREELEPRPEAEPEPEPEPKPQLEQKSEPQLEPELAHEFKSAMDMPPPLESAEREYPNDDEVRLTVQDHIEFVIECVYRGRAWKLPQRFSRFSGLHWKLCADFPHIEVNLANFPPRHFFIRENV